MNVDFLFEKLTDISDTGFVDASVNPIRSFDTAAATNKPNTAQIPGICFEQKKATTVEAIKLAYELSVIQLYYYTRLRFAI